MQLKFWKTNYQRKNSLIDVILEIKKKIKNKASEKKWYKKQQPFQFGGTNTRLTYSLIEYT